MPTYEFRCASGHSFDRFFRTMSSAHTTLRCPECGAMAERQLSGGAGLHFKGAGFYLTDYGKNAHRKPEAADGMKAGDGAASAKEGAGKESSGERAAAGEGKAAPESAPAASEAAPAVGTGKKPDGAKAPASASKPKAE